MKLRFAGVLVSMALGGCSPSGDDRDAQAEQALNADPSPVKQCNLDRMLNISPSFVSATDMVEVCKMARAEIGRDPSVRLLRRLANATWTLRTAGLSDDPLGNAAYFLRATKLRGSFQADENAMANFELMFKIVNGTGGKVQPSDIFAMLAGLGKKATKISDEGLINMASTLAVSRDGR